MNRRKTLALLLSILLHLAAFTLLWLFLHRAEQKMLTSSGAKRVELSLSDFVTPPPAPAAPKKSIQPPTKTAAQPKPKQKPAQKPVPKPNTEPKQKRMQKERKTPKQTPKSEKAEAKTAEKSGLHPAIERKEQKPQKKTAAKRVQKEQKSKKSPEKQKETPLSRLAGSLGAPSMPVSEPKPPSIEDIGSALSNSEFRALYKDEFDHFTPEQKKFIRNNLSRIQGITQHYLTIRGYPYTAARLGQSGMNIVEFDLHPNGDISGLKVIKGAGFEDLDINSLDTIKTAYKDYPRPKEKTKIRFYIYYRLY